MKELYRHELPRWMRWLGAWRINKESIDFNWGYFAPRFGFEAVLHRGGYFDTRYAVSLCLIWGRIHIYLPFRTSLGEGCNLPQYGFAIHHDTFWIYIGGKFDKSIGQCTGNDQWITWYLPFFSWVFDGHWIKDQNKQWVLMDKNLQAYEFRQDQAYIEKHHFTYILKNGTIQERTATCSIEKRKWHRKWFPFLTKVSEVIDIEFSDEVGERSGSWKGGTIGCGYDMEPNETIEQCLRRMEKERKF